MALRGTLCSVAWLAVGLSPYARVLAQTPTQDEAAYRKAVGGVRAKLPPGTRHEFVMMPLRDGVKLATDVFLPEGPGPWPVALLRTPYSRFDARGYAAMEGVPSVTVVQNQRAKYGSEGGRTFRPEDTWNEVDDGYDCIEWIAKQPWSNGKVAMWGPSGHGVCATSALWSNSPHLTLVSTNITGDNLYLYWAFSNGARRQMYTWLSQRTLKITDWTRPTPSLRQAATGRSASGAGRTTSGRLRTAGTSCVLQHPGGGEGHERVSDRSVHGVPFSALSLAFPGTAAS